ncbi:MULTISPECIES: ATP-binding protein [Spirulina sp. CCY15215]|uniref:sensor histidine kinase n=1 Tax=Spirulina sp. CCY15215 TaxID=2767591 RepID=UPI00195134BC|nr:ATP-binding protein [Spirulina major]
MQNKFGSEKSSHASKMERDLDLDTTLQELPLYDSAIAISCLGVELADLIAQNPRLPGVLLTDGEELVGIVSRRQLLEYLLLPQGMGFFLDQPLQVFWGHNNADILILPGNMHILTGMQRALKRSPRIIADPIVVQLSSSEYRILDFGQLSLVSWQIRGIEAQVRYERSHAQMIQTEKMASLGRLVDGIAHEILDPVGFIWGNLTHISSYSQDLLNLLSAYEGDNMSVSQKVENLRETIEISYLQKDFPQAVESIATGAKRLRDLAMSLQNFCHVDEVYPKPADLHSCLDGIILLLKSRLSSDIQIVRNYGHLPPIVCYIGKLTQVFTNIFTNAIDALLDRAATQKWKQEFDRTFLAQNPPKIEIETQIFSRSSSRDKSIKERFISIRIVDNGIGMTLEQQEQIRDSFSIERRAAKETSLAISYQIVTAKHGGTFNFKSQLGEGSEFEIILPLLQ